MTKRLPKILQARPWQNLYFLVYITIDIVAYAGLFALLITKGSVGGTLLFSLLFKIAVLLCLLYFPRAGWVLTILTPPALLQFTAKMLLPDGARLGFEVVFWIFHYYCLFCPANRRYCRSFRSYDDGVDPSASWFTALSNKLNRYKGMRVNAAPDVLVGPSPFDQMPAPLERDWDGTEQPDPWDEEAYTASDGGTLSCAETGAPVTPAEAEAYDRFNNKQSLGELRFTVLLHPSSPIETDGLALLAACDAYSFLKAEYGVNNLFHRACSAASSDLRGYAAPPRKGVGAWDDILNKNAMRVIVTMHEEPFPLENSVFAEFCVNC